MYAKSRANGDCLTSIINSPLCHVLAFNNEPIVPQKKILQARGFESEQYGHSYELFEVIW